MSAGAAGAPFGSRLLRGAQRLRGTQIRRVGGQAVGPKRRDSISHNASHISK
jgi:hypothetical protein